MTGDDPTLIAFPLPVLNHSSRGLTLAHLADPVNSLLWPPSLPFKVDCAMPLFKSLRSKSSSRKSIASSVTTTNGGITEKDTDFAPHSTSSANYGSVKSIKADASSPVKKSSSPSLPRYVSSASVRAAKASNAPTELPMVRSFSEMTPQSQPRSEDPSNGKPRPSDLFAGKGVQWSAVKLAGPNVTPTPVAGSNNPEDLQNFLKQRRQWKPTFATEDENGKLDDDFEPPEDLSKLSFASGYKVQNRGIMSFKDLDESHTRKERLLSAKPLGGSLWDEAETSKAASARSAKAHNATIPGASKEATKYAKKPSALRTASFQSTKSAKKFFGGGGKTSAPPQAMPPPPRESSAVKTVKSTPEKNSAKSKAVPPPIAEGGALGVTGMAPPVAAANVNTIPEDEPAAKNIEEMALTSAPNGVQPETIAGEDADKTLTTNDVEKIPLAKEEGEVTGAVSEIPQTLDTEEAEEVTVDAAAAAETVPEAKVADAVDVADVTAPSAAPPTVPEGTHIQAQ